MLSRWICVALLLLAASVTSRAADIDFRRDSILIFAGVFSTGNISQSLNPFYKHEDSYIVGGAYGRGFMDLGAGFVLGGEVGLAGRLGDSTSAEVWAGPSLRHQGISLGGVSVSPGFVFGLSAVTGTMGVEREREIRYGGNATLLFYLGPELAFRFSQWPNAELVYRLHHRSGLYGTLGKMEDGHNANLLGLRFRL